MTEDIRVPEWCSICASLPSAYAPQSHSPMEKTLHGGMGSNIRVRLHIFWSTALRLPWKVSSRDRCSKLEFVNFIHTLFSCRAACAGHIPDGPGAGGAFSRRNWRCFLEPSTGPIPPSQGDLGALQHLFLVRSQLSGEFEWAEFSHSAV